MNTPLMSSSSGSYPLMPCLVCSITLTTVSYAPWAPGRKRVPERGRWRPTPARRSTVPLCATTRMGGVLKLFCKELWVFENVL